MTSMPEFLSEELQVREQKYELHEEVTLNLAEKVLDALRDCLVREGQYDLDQQVYSATVDYIFSNKHEVVKLQDFRRLTETLYQRVVDCLWYEIDAEDRQKNNLLQDQAIDIKAAVFAKLIFDKDMEAVVNMIERAKHSLA